ncbi:MAG: AAA family ATPase [Chloroflexi bacterium]|nr:AAA family ATPase [Chloroflexota bacterium]
MLEGGPLQRPIVCPVLVGRAAHLAALDACLAQVRAEGTGQMVLIQGEAGVGKSRLVAELAARAAGAGATVLQGACFESDEASPYAPFVDLLRSGQARQAMTVALPSLGPLVDDLSRLVPELSSPGRDPAGAEPAPDRQRLHYAIAQLLIELARSRPLVLIFEDLHWSDDASLECLHYLARGLQQRPILLLLTFRPEDVQPGLGQLLAAAERQRLALELPVTPLSAEQVDLMVQAILANERPARPDFVRELHALTEGNPFFVEEVLRSLIHSGAVPRSRADQARLRVGDVRIPRSVREAVQRRESRLSVAARRSLTLAAVLGQRCDLALLRELTGCSESELLPQLRELVAAGLLTETAVDQFAFQHALTRGAVYGELLERERQLLHASVVETLERLHPRSDAAALGQLAHHSYEAGDASRTLRYAQLAGERAAQLYAPGAAAEQFGRAIEAARQLQLPVSAALLRSHGRALDELGSFEPAQRSLEAGLARARAEQDDYSAWQLLLDLALLWSGRDYRRAGAYAREALSAARTSGDPSRLAHTLNRVANWHLNMDAPAEALPMHREALRLFEALGDRQGEAGTLDLLALATFVSGDLVGGAPYMARAIALFRELGDRHGRASCLATYLVRHPTYQTATLVADIVDADALRREIDEAVQAARAIDWRVGEAFAQFNAGYCLAARGFYAEALRASTASLRIAEEVEHRQWTCGAHAVLGAIHHDLLDFERGREHLEQACSLAREVGSRHWSQRASGLLALLLVDQRDLPAARSIVDAAAPQGAATGSWGQRLLTLAAAELALASGQPDVALVATRALIDSAPNAEGTPIPRLLLLRARAEQALGDVDLAGEALETAARAAERWGLQPLAWRIALEQHRQHRGQGRMADARAAASRAWRVVHALGAGLTDDRLRTSFLTEASRRLPAPGRQPASTDPLTPREREVAALVAGGCSNREIADRLVVGERTVETHVSNILAKLGKHSRVEIAAWATERALRT